MKIKLLLLTFYIKLVMPYHFIIVPGLGGSVLYNTRQRQIWPIRLQDIGLNYKHLAIDPLHTPHIYDTLLTIGDLDCIKIDSQYTYLLTKNTYYSTMTDFLVKHKHRVSSLPYDFRYILKLEYQYQLYNEYKLYIENVFNSSKEKMIMIAHSAGGLILHHFLTSFVDDVWIKKHITKVYYVSVPFGGCYDSLYFLLDLMRTSSSNLFQDINIFKLLSNIPNFKLCNGLYMCLPVTTDPILRYNGKWIYSHNLHTLFSHNKQVLNIYNLAIDFTKYRNCTIDIPQVVIYGTGHNTTLFKDYDNHILLKGDGDNTVSTDSLTFTKILWKTQPYYVEIKNKEHSRINSYYPVLQMISENKTSLDV